MKRILFIGYTESHYQQSMIYAFESNGFEVIVPKILKYREVNRLVKFLYKDFHKGNFIKKQNTLYISCLLKEKPDFVFIVNDHFIAKDFLELCKQNFIPVYGYSQDSIKFCNDALEGNNIYGHLKYYDVYYSYEPTDVKYEIKEGEHVKYLPLGFDERYYFNGRHESIEYMYDICFVGGLDKRRLEFLEAAAKLATEKGYKMLVVTGIQLKKIDSCLLLPKLISRQVRFRTKYKYLWQFISNEFVGPAKLAELYSKTKICLNIHQGTHPEDHTGPNPRTFETMASGAMQIIDKGHIGVTNLIVGEDLIEFSNNDDLINNLDFYLKNDATRLAIGRNGHKKVWKLYTQKNLVKTIIANEGMLNDKS